MNKVNIRFELNQRADRNGLHNIQLLVSVDGKRKKTKTPISVKKADFNSKCRGENWVRSSAHNSAALNAELSKILASARAAYFDAAKKDSAVTSETVVKSMFNKPNGSFIQFYQNEAERVRKTENMATYFSYRRVLNFLKEFLQTKGMGDLAFNQLTPKFIQDFDTFLANGRGSGEKVHSNTVRSYMKYFSSVVSKAVRIGEIRIEENGFNYYEKRREIVPQKSKLTEQEIAIIENLNIEKGSMKWHIRNYFLFSYYCAGMRFGDVARLVWGNIVDGCRLVYRMEKNDKLRDLILVDRAKEILNLYKKEDSKNEDLIFPIYDQSADYMKELISVGRNKMSPEMALKYYIKKKNKLSTVNKHLCEIGEMANINKKITFHIARHSFASVAMREGVSNAAIQKLMAHSSLSITERYMGGFNTQEIDNSLLKVFGSKESEQSETMGEDMAKIVKALSALTKEQRDVIFQFVKGIDK